MVEEGKASLSIVLLIVGFQFLIHVNGAPVNANAPIVSTLLGIVTLERGQE